VNVQFSGETDSATVQPSFRIEPASAGQFYQAALTFSWQPEPELETSTTYRVTISTALRSAEGAPLGAPYEVTFTTVPFRVDTSWPPANSLGNPLGSDINVWCTANIDTTSVRSAFSIAPPVAGTLLLNDRSSTYRPVLLTPATEYTVTVSTALRSRRGAHRSAVHRFSFRTEGEP
jgi:hypothetical protein